MNIKFFLFFFFLFSCGTIKTEYWDTGEIKNRGRVIKMILSMEFGKTIQNLEENRDKKNGKEVLGMDGQNLNLLILIFGLKLSISMGIYQSVEFLLLMEI